MTWKRSKSCSFEKLVNISYSSTLMHLKYSVNFTYAPQDIFSQTLNWLISLLLKEQAVRLKHSYLVSKKESVAGIHKIC